MPRHVLTLRQACNIQGSRVLPGNSCCGANEDRKAHDTSPVRFSVMTTIKKLPHLATSSPDASLRVLSLTTGFRWKPAESTRNIPYIRRSRSYTLCGRHTTSPSYYGVTAVVLYDLATATPRQLSRYEVIHEPTMQWCSI